VRKAKTTAARAICSGATRQGKALEFTQLVVHGDAVAMNICLTGNFAPAGLGAFFAEEQSDDSTKCDKEIIRLKQLLV